MKYTPLTIMLHKLLTVFPLPYHVFPMITCDANGQYDSMQSALMLPVTMGGVIIKYCVEAEWGMRLPNKPIVYAKSEQELDCSTSQEVDADCKYGKCSKIFEH